MSHFEQLQDVTMHLKPETIESTLVTGTDSVKCRQGGSV